MSGSALSIARMDWRRLLGVSAADELLAKTEVLLPPQRVISTPDRPHRRDITEFAFVGGDLSQLLLSWADAFGAACPAREAALSRPSVFGWSDTEDGLLARPVSDDFHLVPEAGPVCP